MITLFLFILVGVQSSQILNIHSQIHSLALLIPGFGNLQIQSLSTQGLKKKVWIPFSVTDSAFEKVYFWFSSEHPKSLSEAAKKVPQLIARLFKSRHLPPLISLAISGGTFLRLP